MNLYVSNLAYALTDDELAEAFGAFGSVSSARVVLDRESGLSWLWIRRNAERRRSPFRH